jgi:adenine phosphoribosyltransferase
VADRLDDAVRVVPDFPKPGILFRDITPLLAAPDLFREAVERLAAPFLDAGVTHVVGVESRGYWFGPALAERLGAGFVPVRKPGKLPRAVLRETYQLEYGTDALELHADAFEDVEGARALIHDDVLATGGTASAAARLVRTAGAEVAGFSFLVEIAVLGGQTILKGTEPEAPLEAVLGY